NLGVRLFSRDKGQVIPTPAGDAFYQRCLELLRIHEEAKRAAQSSGQGAAGQLVVGLMPTMTRCALAPVLASFMQANPNVRVKIVEGYSGTLTQQIRAGELGFATPPPPPREPASALVPAFAGAAGLPSPLPLPTPEVLVPHPASKRTHMAPVQL